MYSSRVMSASANRSRRFALPFDAGRIDGGALDLRFAALEALDVRPPVSRDHQRREPLANLIFEVRGANGPLVTVVALALRDARPLPGPALDSLGLVVRGRKRARRGTINS
jgi:hypothetical protein